MVAPDLTGHIIAGRDFVDFDEEPDDLHGHGTHVAGVIAASTNNGLGVAGVAPGANVLAVRVLDADGGGFVSDVAAGITYSADRGARVINLSLGGPAASTTLRNALSYARSKGALPVCAAGNDYGPPLRYPAAYPECFSVAATDSSDRRAFFSSYGAGLDISAPGQEIFSTYLDGYISFDGTSMATPMVAGVAGILSSQGLTAGQIVDRIQATASDLGVPGYDLEYGHGRVDAYAAVSGSPPAPPPSPPAPPQPQREVTTVTKLGVQTTTRSRRGKCYFRRNGGRLKLECWGGKFSQVTYRFTLPQGATLLRVWSHGSVGCCRPGNVTRKWSHKGARYTYRVRVTNWRAYEVRDVKFRYSRRVRS
jgi:subtilisin family serine protease